MSIGTDTYLAIFSVILTTLVFLIGYRQTIGERRDRARLANREIVETVLKRVMVEETVITLDDIIRYIKGKSRDCAVPEGQLHRPADVIRIIYSRLVENDYITAAHREKITLKVRGFAAAHAEHGYATAPEVRTNGLALVALGLLAVAFSTLTFLVTWMALQGDLSRFTTEGLTQLAADPNFTTGLIGSIVAAVVAAGFTQLKESQDRHDDGGAIDEELDEHTVARLLERRGLKPQAVEGGLFDLKFAIGDKEYGVAVRPQARRNSRKLVQSAVARLEPLVGAGNLARAYIIAPGRLPDYAEKVQTDNVRIVAFDEFRRDVTALQGA